MSQKRIKANYYSVDKIGFDRQTKRYIRITNPNDCLYSGATYITKLRKEDLPEWYVEGYFYKHHGFMNTKGITDIYYRPCWFSNHFLKDDFLYLKFGGKMTISDKPGWDAVQGYDEYVYGYSIIQILKGAYQWSGIDLESFIEALEQKRQWLIMEYPDDPETKSYAKIDHVRSLFDDCYTK